MTHKNSKWFLFAIASQCIVALTLKKIYPSISPTYGQLGSAQAATEVQTEPTAPIPPIALYEPSGPNMEVTNLMRAAGDGQCAEVAKLLKNGDDVLAKNKNGTDALIYAASAGHKDCVTALLNAGANAGTVDRAGDSALSAARQQGFSDIVALIENAKSRQ
jgi:ankyrin repeat protein